MNARAYGYVRVSTDKQENSIEVQTRQIERYWSGRREELDPIPLDAIVVDEGTSGAMPLFHRPHGRQLAGLQRGDHIIITKIDRGFRNTKDALTCLEVWDKAGIILHLLEFQLDASTAVGKFIFTVICGVAEFENNRKAERIREVNAMRNRQGLPNATGGSYAMGWKKQPGGKFSDPWVPDMEVRELAEEASDLYIAGMTYEQIYIAWRQAGVRRKNGNQWLPEPIARLVKAHAEGFPQLSLKKRKLYEASMNGQPMSTPGPATTRDSIS
ncbi:MAG: recombinase family protein [Chloroflexi bacterium]|nr:recombinase family protein [Chloroflexota bacterium]